MELTTAVSSLSCKAAIIVNELRELRCSYKDTMPTNDTICQEVDILRAILSRVQHVLERDGAKGVEFNDELRDVFDVAITSSTVVLMCLDAEVKKLLAGAKGAGDDRGSIEAKCLWRQGTMMDLLQKLREQQNAVSLLFQCFQMESIFELHHLLRERAAELHQAQAAADSLREAHPDVEMLDSVLEPTTGSSASNTEFSFDKELINSEAYRRVLIKARPRHRPKSPELDSIPEMDNGEASTKTAKI